MSTFKPTQQLSSVEFGHFMVVLPAAKAIDLVKLLQSGAALGDWDYSDGAMRRMKIEIRPIGEIRLTTLSPSQIKNPEPPATRGKKRATCGSAQVPDTPED